MAIGFTAQDRNFAEFCAPKTWLRTIVWSMPIRQSQMGSHWSAARRSSPAPDSP